MQTNQRFDEAPNIELAPRFTRARRWLHWPRTSFDRRHFGFRTSMIAHAAALIILALWHDRASMPSAGGDLSAGWSEVESADAEASGEGIALDAASLAEDSASLASAVASSVPALEGVQVPPVEITQPARQTERPAPLAGSNESGQSDGQARPLGQGPGPIATAGGLEGRGRRGELALARGGTRQSEAAVERALNWLAAHQFQDGSWHFNHALDGGPCDGYCRDAGKNASSTGATAMALLAFYGGGYTHKTGAYEQQVNKGVYYLGRRMLLTPNGGDFQEGTMYAQGLSAIALCEAYAMTEDEGLRPPAEQAIRFILYAQDRKGGGWRYTPGEPGDTTMHGWQLMALKSATLAGIWVPSPAWHSAGRFLDSVQTDGGAAYGYRTPQRLETTTAVGLLCRMYMGWDRERDALVRGVAYLDKIGPSKTNMYYNYYATQVMHHYGGEPWKRWNRKMRDYLIATQAQIGHEAGSWHFDDQHGNVGGRLYTTAMAVMTLEVYYRYMPLYGERAVQESY